MRSFDLSLYLVTDRALSLERPIEEVVKKAVQGGVTMVQLREKFCTTREFYHLAMALKDILYPLNIPLIINDRLDIALACNAEGLHIGQSDIPYKVARNLLGEHKIIGLSVENIQDVWEANTLDVDYIGISPVFDTSTKTDTAPALGLEGIREIVKISKHPSVGIGGINKTNIADVISSGANGAAVVSAIMSALDPEKAAKELKSIIDKIQ